MITRIPLSVTCNASGVGATTAGASISGWLVGIAFTLGTLASGAADVTFSTVNSGAAATLLTLTDAAASATYYPLAKGCSEAGALNSTYTEKIWIDGAPKMAVAQGGNGGAGSCIFYVASDPH